MPRKKICILVGQANENTQKSFIQGFTHEAYALDYDVCVFSMFQKFQQTSARNMGDSNIYNLVNYDLFEAVIYMKDTIMIDDSVKEIEKKLEKFNGPVLVIDSTCEGYESIMIDHKTPLVYLTDHLIEKHGYKDIIFLNGKRNHPHSRQRLAGFLESMESHGLHVADEDIHYGNYWFDSGYQFAEKLISSGRKMPEAIVCANDCMAMGAAKILEKNGYKVPDDVAIVGYDSLEEGRQNLTPLTSAYIPAKSCGRKACLRLHTLLTGEEHEEIKMEVEMFIGTSCGCSEAEVSRKDIREISQDNWDTMDADYGYYSGFNHIMDDLISQTEQKRFFCMINNYIYQIKGYTGFSICINDNWYRPDHMIGDKARIKGYTKRMYRIIHDESTFEDGGKVSFTDIFNSSRLLPELDAEREYPTTFFFTPIYFENKSFGYCVVNYGNRECTYDDIYWNWNRSVAQCMESFFRQDAMRIALDSLQSTQVRDSLTGLHNYRGFLAKAKEGFTEGKLQNKDAVITAVDLCRLREINSGYGRKEGDEAIAILASVISNMLEKGELSARMGNDDFIIASWTTDGTDERGEKVIEKVENAINEFNASNQKAYKLEVACGSMHRVVCAMEDLEQLVNDAVSCKNKKKQELAKERERNLSEEDIERDKLVKDILDNNRFVYHFQPIVSAENGNIFAYEALMRANVEKRISPPEILQSAERMRRLYDIEKATFFNVVEFIEHNRDFFEGKKVFINSIPGCQLVGEDSKIMHERLAKLEGRIVIEFTEETEIDDEHLKRLKDSYNEMNIETAIDDYGSGYSNINNLLRYMPKYVKIDRMLITEIQDNPQKQHFVRDIIEFAHDNDILTLAEGVETTEEMKQTIKLGVDLIQGYYTARPAAVPLDAIEQNIAGEIVLFSRQGKNTAGDRVYMASASGRVSMVQVVSSQYNSILIDSAVKEDVSIVGNNGLETDVTIKFADDFEGRVILDNVNLKAEKGVPCIILGEHTKVEIVLVGKNYLKNGGIKVPENAELTITGDGDLYISITSGRYFGIGNDIKSKHGKLIFKQEGMIEISANGMRGIGIGAGYGGNIDIQKGAYDIELNGQDGVGIGAIYESANINMASCDLEVRFNITTGVIIGSCEKNADIMIQNLSARLTCGSNMVSAIGTLMGEKVNCTIANASVNVKLLSAEYGYGIGGRYAKTDTDIRFAQFSVNIVSKHAVAIGDDNFKSKLTSYNSEIRSKLKCNNEYDLGVAGTNMEFVNGNVEFTLNDVPVERKTVFGKL